MKYCQDLIFGYFATITTQVALSGDKLESPFAPAGFEVAPEGFEVTPEADEIFVHASHWIKVVKFYYCRFCSSTRWLKHL